MANLPVIMIIVFGFWYGCAWLLDRKKEKVKERWPSATKSEIDFLLSVDDDIKLN